MRGRIVVVLGVSAVVVGCLAASAFGTSGSFGVTQTRSCLTHAGAVVGSAVDPAITALPAAEQRKVVSGVLPPGTTTLVLVIGTSAADAVALRERIAAKVEFKPTAANSRRGQDGNAAWFVESLTRRPSLAASNSVKNCLRAGPSSTPPPALTRSGVSGCVDVHSGDVLDKATRRVLFPQIPATVDSYLLVALVPGDNGSSQGIFAFVLFGKTSQQSIALRAALLKALSGHLAGETTDQGRGAAWLTIPTRRATGSQLRGARRVFAGCVA